MRNPLRWIGIYKAADALVDDFEDASKHPDLYREPAYWRRVLLAATALGDKLPLPSQGRQTMNNALSKIGMIAGLVAAGAGSIAPGLAGTKAGPVVTLIGTFAAMLAGLFHSSPTVQPS